MDLREQFSTAGCRRLWALVQGLPPEAVLWADMQPVRTAAPGRASEEPVEERPAVTRDPKEIAAFFGKHLK